MANSVALKHPTIPHLVYYVRADALPTEGAGESARPPDKKPRLIAFTKPAGPPRLVAFTRTGATRPNPYESGGMEKWHGMIPEEKPELEWPAPPHEKPNLARRPAPEEKPRLWRRGKDYPRDYHGFVDDTYIDLSWSQTSTAKTCRLYFGEWKQAKIDVTDMKVDRSGWGDLGPPDWLLLPMSTRIWFYKRVGGNVNQEIWPGGLDVDLFDAIHLVIESGKKAVGARITVVLNGVTILGPDHVLGVVTGKVNLSADILKCKLGHVSYSDSPVLRLAAKQLGKAWHPKFGGCWNREGGGKWKSRPENWCSEFACWVIRNATHLDGPHYGEEATVWEMARYFSGLELGSDLARGYIGTKPVKDATNIVVNRFLTPTKRIVLYEESEDRALTLKAESIPQDVRDEYDDAHLPTPTYYEETNPNFCSWEELSDRVKPGYYVKLLRGAKRHVGWSTGFNWLDHVVDKLRRLVEMIPPRNDRADNHEWGHSAFFVRWADGGFNSGDDHNTFKAISGNWGNRVAVAKFHIDRRNNTRWEDADGAGGWPWEIITKHAGKYEVLNDIFWKASQRACGRCGYPDGFGITDLPRPAQLKPELKKV